MKSDNGRMAGSAMACCGVTLLMGLAGQPACAAETPDGSAVLAQRHDITLTRADFDADLQRVPEKYRLELLASRERIGMMVEGLLLNRVIAVDAKKSGLDKEPTIARRLKLLEERFLAEEYVNALIKRVAVPDFEKLAEEDYQAHPRKHTSKPIANASHILVRIKDKDREEALKRAEAIYQEAIAGADFAELASTRSEDPSAKKNSGKLGNFTPDNMVKPFSDAAFALEPGQISKPVESKFGFHIIKLHEKQEGQKKEYAEVRQQIIDKMTQEYFASAKMDFIKTLRESGELQYKETEIAKLKTSLPSVHKKNPADGLPDGEKK